MSADREPSPPGFPERSAVAALVGLIAAAVGFRNALGGARAALEPEGYAALGFARNQAVELAAAVARGLAGALELGLWTAAGVLAALLAVGWIPALRTPSALARALRGALVPALLVAGWAGFVLLGLARLAGERESRGAGWLAPSDLAVAGWALAAGIALAGAAALLARSAERLPAGAGVGRAAWVRAVLVGGGVLLALGYWENRGIWTPPKESGVFERNAAVALAAAAAFGGVLWRWRRGPRPFVPAAALLVLAGAAWAFAPALRGSGGGAAALVARRPLNVVVLALDTVRADQTSLLGGGPEQRDTTPNLARLAERGLNFTRAITQAPWTIPAFASVLTGRYPHEHGALVLDAKLGAAQVTLAEVLREAGYETHGVVSHLFLQRYRGFAQGYDGYDERPTLVPDVHRASTSAQVSDGAIEFLAREHRRPFFLFAHYFDPHYEYQDHPETDFADGYRGWFRDQLDFENLQKNARLLGEAERQWLLDLYREELLHTDRHIGRVLAYLEQSGLAESTIVVAVADHGESFGEHGYFGHTINVDQEVLHVPLVIAPPRGHPIAPRVIDETVETRMLFGTLLSLLDVQWADRGDRGPAAWGLEQHKRQSLTRLAERGDPGEGRAFSGVFLQDTEPRHAKRFKRAALVGDRYKLVFDLTRGREELYDLEADPHELAPLGAGAPAEVLGRMRADLNAWLAAMEGRAAEVRGAEPRPDQARALDRLGYTGACGGKAQDEGSGAPEER
jgi:arylsulfatase